ncbi:MAG TPA: hypothetical protein VI749_03820 [Candidatus Omnitrophota bacterium]|nr:hypothetical protein [Candidatus Omnitrophota bacterium]
MVLTLKRTVFLVLLAAIAASLYLRFDGLKNNDLFYYDEGHYLTIHRTFDELLSKNPPRDFQEVIKILKYNLYLSLSTGKGLWFFLSHLRSFWGEAQTYYFPKLLAATFGIATVILVYFFSYRYYGSRETALLSAAVLALLPSHVYYSRLGLQETLSALCLLAGFASYFFIKKFSVRVICSGVFFALSYFSNYRMFIFPLLVGFVEMYLWLTERASFNPRRFVWSMLTAAIIIMFFGLLNNAGHFSTIFFWMIRQGESAKGHFELYNLLSYPYAVFRLEGILFGLFFFVNMVFLIQRRWKITLPFCIALLYMMIFSFAHEKGLRYLCVVMPFMSMAVASSVVHLARMPRWAGLRAFVVALAFLMLLQQAGRANTIRTFSSDYQQAMKDALANGIDTKVLSTQSFVQNLYSPKRDNVKELPHQFSEIAVYYSQGYQYIMLDPQAYISYTQSKKRFDTALEDHLEFMLSNIKPVKEYDHFSDAMLERFVLEHNEDLRQCIRFLKANKNGRFNKLRTFAGKDLIEEVGRRLEIRKQQRETGYE